MRKTLTSALILLPLLALACGGDGGVAPEPTTAPSAAPTPGPASYGPLVFSDEFDYQGPPDPAKWDYEIGAIRNNEAQSYTQRLENARVGNGVLLIEGRKEAWSGKDYTSASVITKRKVAFLYGRIEVRAKLPTGKGTWPTWASTRSASPAPSTLATTTTRRTQPRARASSSLRRGRTSTSIQLTGWRTGSISSSTGLSTSASQTRDGVS